MVDKSDDILARDINKFIEDNPYCTRQSIRKKFNIGDDRAARMVASGLVKNYPRSLTPSQAATMAAKNSPWKHFKLPGSPKGATK